MTTKTMTMEDSITLPKEMRRNWKGKRVWVQFSDETIIIKRVREAPFWNTLAALGRQKKTPQKDIRDAIQWARRKS